MSKKKHLPFHIRVSNAVGSQEIERKKAEHAYVHAIGYEREEFDRLWVKSENSTWGHNFGRMVGWDEIYYNHTIDECGRAVEETFELGKLYPEYRGADLRSAGATSVHCLSEGCIEMADDGLSGRGFFVTPGTMGSAVSSRMGRAMMALWEYYGCDFINRDGEWLYVHEHVCPVFGGPYGTLNWGHDMYEKSDDDPSHNQRRPAPCRVTDNEFFSDRYDVHQVVQHLMWECPEPYETLDENNTYSPGRNKF